jgi:hypothetical protein
MQDKLVELEEAVMPFAASHRSVRSVLLALAVAATACQTPRTSSRHDSTVPLEPSASLPPAALTAARVITKEFLRDQITRISADELEGRGPATAGDRAARAYLTGQLAALRLEPGRGPEGWEQPVELIGVKAAMPKAWTFECGPKTLSLSWWDQYIAGSGVQAEIGAVDHAELVFVGYGIEAPEYGWDDFKGHDVKGKVLLMLNNDPDWDPALFGGTTRLYYGRWPYKYESASRHGPAGAIILHTTPSAGYPFQVVRTSWGGRAVRPSEQRRADHPGQGVGDRGVGPRTREPRWT